MDDEDKTALLCHLVALEIAVVEIAKVLFEDADFSLSQKLRDAITARERAGVESELERTVITKLTRIADQCAAAEES